MAKIMVVEDDIVISQVVCEFLKDHGYEVTHISDGKIALETFREESFDLIVLDIMIPSMTGLKSYRRFVRHQKFQFLC